MNISKELIEKYHDGRCTPDERRAVETWLFDDDAPIDPAAPPLTAASKAQLQEAMWREIEPVLPSQKRSFGRIVRGAYWRQAAAILLVTLLGGAAFYVRQQATDNQVIVITNDSATDNQDVQEQAYSLSVGPNSNVSINHKTGRIRFCGAMLINPNRDIELTIQGTCALPGKTAEKLVLKKGNPYIALNFGNDVRSNEVIVLPQRLLSGLPPLLQRQLMRQFNI